MTGVTQLCPTRTACVTQPRSVPVMEEQREELALRDSGSAAHVSQIISVNLINIAKPKQQQYRGGLSSPVLYYVYNFS